MSRYEELVRQADRSAQDGRMEEAISLYNEAIREAPDQVSAHYNLALLHHGRGHVKEAISAFEKVAEIAPGDASTFNNLGVLYFADRALDRAEQSFAKAIEIDPEYVDAIYGIAKVYFEQYRIPDAIVNAQRCLQIRPDMEKASSLLRACEERKDAPEVAAQYRRILIVMDQGIGNMVMLTPTIRAIREQLPKAHIAVLGRQPSVQVIDGWDLVDRVLTAPDDTPYDVGFMTIWSRDYDAQYGEHIRAQCRAVYTFAMDDVDTHEADHHLRIARSLGYRGPRPEPFCMAKDVELDLPSGKTLVGLSDTTLNNGAWERKRWPHYPELARRLMEEGYAVALIGGKGEADRFVPEDWPDGMIHAMGTYDVQETAGLIRRCDLFVGNDSGPAHMAGALGARALVLFGPTRMTKNRPLGPNVTMISAALSCSPCQYTERWNTCRNWRCMSEIGIDEIIEQVRTLREDTPGDRPATSTPSVSAAGSANPLSVLPPKLVREGLDVDVGIKPRDIQIQTISRCNATCAFCPYPKVSKRITHGTMSDELFEKVVRQCRDLNHISPYLMNEPLLDKRLPERIRYIKGETDAVANISTNGSLLTKPLADRLIDAGMDLFMVSLTAGKYSEDAILHLRDRGVDVELVYILTQETAPHLEAFRRKFEGIKILAGVANNRGGNLEEFGDLDTTGFDETATEDMGLCGKLARMLYVLYNGDCVLCCSDYKREVIVGNFRDHTIEEIWNSRMLRMYRSLQAQKLRGLLPLCSTCSYGFKAVPLGTPKKLVAMLRVKDAIETIRECLDSLSSFADEIVVVDNGSTDGTLGVYEEYPKIVDVARTEGFDEGRDKNLVLDMAKRRDPDWIIWIDSDEVFEERMTRKLVEQYMNQTEHTAIWFKQYHFWRDRTHYRIDDRWKPSYQRAMWQNQPGTFFSQDKIHNSLIQGLEGQAFGSDIRLKHYGHVTEAATRKKYELYRQVDNPEASHWTGRDYRHMIDERTARLAEWREDIQEEQRELQASAESYQEALKEADARAQAGQTEEAISLYQTAVKAEPNRPEAYAQWALLHFREGRFSEAETLFEKAASRAPMDASLRNNLGVAQHRQGDLEQARASFEQALAINPKYVDAAGNLKKVRVELINQRLALASTRYGVDRYPLLKSSVETLRDGYAAATNLSVPVAERLRRHQFAEPPQDDKREVLFLSVNPRVDMAKKADALRQLDGYRVRMLCHNGTGDVLDEFFGRFYDEVIPYANLVELTYFLLALKPDVIVARPKNQVAALAILLGNAPVVFNVYDIEAINTPEESMDPRYAEADALRLNVETERFCMENAAGIIHKGRRDEIDTYIRPKYDVRAPVLHFYPFCWERYFAPEDTPKLSREDGIPHLVYTGVVSPSSMDRRLVGHSQFAPMIETVTEQKVHWHIYYNPETGVNDGYYQEYFDLAERNPYFHFHSPLPYHRLSSEIAKYDYGYMVHDTRGALWGQSCNDVSMANKIFTYLEAGLPMIVGDSFGAVADFVNEHGVGIVVDSTDLSDLSQRLRSVDYQELRANVLQAREALSIGRHAPELAHLLEEVGGNGKPKGGNGKVMAHHPVVEAYSMKE